MDRRSFLTRGTLVTTGSVFLLNNPAFSKYIAGFEDQSSDQLYELFKNPPDSYRPFVRWWWNGNKIQKSELARELRLLKDVGIGGVEINSISFPDRTDDMGIPSIEWLSDEWIDLLKFTLDEAKSLNITCDLLVGTGFPNGGEFLEDGERSQIVAIGVKKLEGPLSSEFSLFDLYKEADPAISNPYSGRKVEMLNVKLVPDPLNDISEVIDLSDQIKSGVIKVTISEGKYAIYALVKFDGFMRVIQGNPGGMGPVLNHFDTAAIKKYFNHMTDTIQNRIGPLAPNIRSFFVDSLETEGTNWTSDMMDEFKKRRGYDIYPYLPFLLFKIGGMGNTSNPAYTVGVSDNFKSMIGRMRYDFEFTKAEIFHERFVGSFAQWCKSNNIKSRAQAYGRNYFLLEGSFDIDIPECETWLKYGIGEDITEEEFTRYPWHLGQGNTMINKFVSSAAHLKNKRLISSEELTNTAMVFNESLEIFKIAGDQSTISGVTQPVFHGFNYSPKDAAFPGWITYGGYFNEKNTMWPYLKNYTDYRARLSALLQQADMFGDIALLAAIPDMWTIYGAQNEPFPSVVYPSYQLLVWESIQQNGNGCDYVSEDVIINSEMKRGIMSYGLRSYHTIFLINVESLNPKTAQQLYAFIVNGGRVFCIENYPEKSLGWKNFSQNDEDVKGWVEKMKKIPERFILLEKPESNFTLWFNNVQIKHSIKPYVTIKNPKPFITQVRYQNKDSEIFLFTNSSNKHDYTLEATFDNRVIRKKQPSLWDAVTGERFSLELKDGKLDLNLDPADSKLIVFSNDKKGELWRPIPEKGVNNLILNKGWQVEFKHINGSDKIIEMKELSDLKDLPEHAHFCGTVIYRSSFQLADKSAFNFLNLGKVFGISVVEINGKPAGEQWYGHRVYSISDLLQKGNNSIEIKVVTVMVNYMKTLVDNKVAQYWTNEKRKDQPLQSMGLAGPVTIY